MTEAFETNKLIYQEVMKLLKMRKTVTKKEVEKHLKQYLSGNQRYRLTRILAEMLKQQIVEIRGSKYRGHYKLRQQIDEDRSWIATWKGLKLYDRMRSKTKKESFDPPPAYTPQTAPSTQTSNHIDQVAIAFKAHENAEEALRQLDKIQLVQELIRTRERAQAQGEQLRDTRTELGSLRDDYDIAMKQVHELLQENAALHAKLNGRNDGKLS